ncbi:MAG: sigma-70 family RNA polymerase sigma factor, partial [Oscillospiraceae bacterium]
FFVRVGIMSTENFDKVGNNFEEYAPLTDWQLIKLCKSGDESAFSTLISRYTPLIKSRLSKIFTQVFDKDDLFQECLIAFLSCIYNFDNNKGYSFSSYAEKCISNKMISVIRYENTEKNKPLSDYLSIDDCENETLTTQHYNFNYDPSSIFIEKEEIEFMENQVKIQLSCFEQKALNLYLCGYSYEEMATVLDTTTKSIDNALQRIRRKLRG